MKKNERLWTLKTLFILINAVILTITTPIPSLSSPQVVLPYPVVAPKPQVYDTTALELLTVSEDASVLIAADDSDEVAKESLSDALSEMFLGLQATKVKVSLINSDNLLHNASFEEHSENDLLSWNEDWPSVLNFYDSSVSLRGSGSEKIMANASSPFMARINQDFEVEAHTDYAFEVWVKTQGVGLAYAEVWTKDRTGALHDYYATPVISGTNDWTLLRGRFNSGVYTNARIFLRLHGATGSCWFDCVRLFRDSGGAIDENLPLQITNVPSEIINKFSSYTRGLAEWQEDSSYLLCGLSPAEGETNYYIIGSSEKGRFYGVQSLLQILRQSSREDIGIKMPYGFYIIDYPDFPVRGMTYFDAKQTAFFGESPMVSVDGLKRLRYLANLKLTEIIFSFADAFGNGMAWDEADRLFSWNPETMEWEENANALISNYWSKFGDLVDRCRTLHLEPIFCVPLVSHAIGNVYDFESFPEGVLCNQIEFQVMPDSSIEPVKYAPALTYSNNLLANPGFEVASDQRTRTQNPINGNVYRHILPGEDLNFYFGAAPYSDLEITMTVRSEKNPSDMPSPALFLVSDLASNISYARTNSLAEPWAEIVATMTTDGSLTRSLTFVNASNNLGYCDVDDIQVWQRNVVRNPGFEFHQSEKAPLAWTVSPAGGTLSFDAGHMGGQSLKINRASPSGLFTRISQDFACTPNETFSCSAWVKHTNGGAYCEVYDLSGSNLVEDSYVPSRVILDGDRDWYKQEFTFTSNSAGTFRLYLRFHGTGTAWFDDIVVRPKNPVRVYQQSFEDSPLSPESWATTARQGFEEVPSESQQNAETSADGLSSLRVTGPSEVSQSVIAEPRTDYQMRILYDPSQLGENPYAYLLPRAYIVDSSSNILMDQILNTSPVFFPKWRPFKHNFSVGNSNTLKFSILTATLSQNFDGACLAKTNWIKNASFEFMAGANNFEDWDEVDNLGISPSTISCLGDHSIQFTSGPGSTLVRAAQTIEVAPSTDYRFEVMVKKDSTDGAYAEVWRLDSGGNLLDYVPSNVITTATDWALLSANFNSKESSRVRFYLRHVGDSGHSWFDNARIFPYSFVKNGSFENTELVDNENGWDVVNGLTGISLDAANHSEGGKSIKISSSSGNTDYQRAMWQVFDVQPWTTLQLNYDTKYAAASNVRLRAEVSPFSAKANPDSDTWSNPFYFVNDEYPNGAREWETRGILFNSGRHNRVIVYLYVGPWNSSANKEEGNWSGDFWFDNITITTIPNNISEETLDYDPTGDKVHVEDIYGNSTVEGVDYSITPPLSAPMETHEYKLSANNAGTLSLGEHVFVSWNDKPSYYNACMQNEKLYAFAERLFQSYQTHMGLNKFHVQFDDGIITNVDGRSLSAGLTDSQQIINSLTRLEQLCPEGASILAWGDSFDRYHPGHDFNSEITRALNTVPPEIRIMPWEYVASGTHMDGFRRLAERRALDWVATAGADRDTSNTVASWMRDSLPNSNLQGVSWSTWSPLFIESNAIEMEHFRGLVVTGEMTWNQDGYTDGLPDTYNVDVLNTTLGDMSSARYVSP